nr:hypothetical protein [Tanacetum cinerariifolium]GEV12091.1 hypothetical protein [Tanacetum cinerariifolium]
MRATGTPFSSSKGTMWYLFDLTPSGKERDCVYFNFPFAIKQAIGLNVFLQDPSPHGMILLLISLLNYFHREVLQNSVTTSLCSNNIKESLFLKHGLVSRTYSKKTLTMASIFGSKSKSFMIMSIPPQDEPLTNRLVDFLDCHLPEEWKIARDVEINPFKDVRVFRRLLEFLGSLPINLKRNMWESKDLIDNLINWDKPPKNKDEAWHAKINLIDLDGEEFTKTLQSIPTSKKLSERESPKEIINLDHFYDT